MTAAQTPEVGVETVSQNLYDGVCKYHAQIGHDVPMSTLRKLLMKMTQEAQQRCYEKKWEEALNTFMQCLALSEKVKGSSSWVWNFDDEHLRGTLVHNIGFCLHCLGEYEAAKAYYEQSIELMQKTEGNKPMSKKVIEGLLSPEQYILSLFVGGLTENRIRMTKERLIDCAFARKPDLKMMNGWGLKRNLPDKSEGREAADSLTKEWVETGNASADAANAEPADSTSRPSWLNATGEAQAPKVPSMA
mmetsp:Transcript_51576/g.85528  ORF Transcript_51576/g.85528 Transcript_51576/m.85528 type:complete len:247 (-) Transcript_51576:325-1065(-)|eukprot:CAMPEP_0119311178 /NCGR_PEP_ID=MMETSP1333-20130426/21957_1 /TAXON_ID=418940 /ORGANISM="Scyphosphaera apsteinii, Strain RCC1455" /LENGTH=246 /DNA_ID=CAMNT_0007315503 /DNA_START=24 /DNA_END=764 /DNA_ORIENTATION=+